MSRQYDGFDTDRLDGPTITAYNSGAFSMGAWVYTDDATATSAQGIIEVNDGTSSIQYMTVGDAYHKIVCGQRFNGTSWFGSLGIFDNALTTTTWQFVVCTHPGTTTTSSIACWVGDVSTSMSSITLAAGLTDGGTRVTGGTNVVVGNHTGIGFRGGSSGGSWDNNATGSFNGRIFAPFMVPWVLTSTEMNALRTGDLCPLTASGTPNFFFGLESAALTSYSGVGPSLTLTSTGTSSSTDPITLTACGGAATSLPLPNLSRQRRAMLTR